MKNTIYIPISREDGVVKTLDQLVAMDFPAQETELIVVLDTASQRFATQVGCALEIISKTKNIGKIKMQMTGEKPLPNDAHVMMRRQRTMSVWNKMKGMIGDTEYFMGLEDDTDFPADAFKELLYFMDWGACYAEGVQQHRQTNSIGAWYITPKTARTLKYKSSGMSKINGGGWYCFMAKTKDVKGIMVREDGAAMGPDVCFVYDLVKKTGRPAMIDWGVKCGHRTDDGVLYANKDTGQLYYKRAIKGDWVTK